MNPTSTVNDRVVILPSDQDASGRTFGEEEVRLLAEAVRSGTLTSTKGKFVKALEKQFSELLGVKHAYACTSGTAAIHTAVAAIDPDPGDEVVTSPITDMGALTPILYQGAIPVFADVEPRTLNVTARTIEPVLSERTRAIIVTHLFGNPCEMGEILKLARSRGIPVIEDCAQAYLTRYDAELVGSLGKVGCFSLQQGKHITTGEGGLVVTNDDALARRMSLFINKAWGYGDESPDHYFLALNYRMTELQGAVAVAQLPKLDSVVRSRIAAAFKLTERLTDLPGIETPWAHPKSVHTYWRYCLRVDSSRIEGGAPGLGRFLKERGISAAPRYIQKPAFMCEVIRDQVTFGKSGFPFRGPHRAGLPPVEYRPEDYPGTAEALAKVCVLPWNELYTTEDVQYIADNVIEVAGELR